jgi:hypothetical protein
VHSCGRWCCSGWVCRGGWPGFDRPLVR